MKACGDDDAAQGSRQWPQRMLPRVPIRHGLLIGAAIVMLAQPPMRPATVTPQGSATAAPTAAAARRYLRIADFGNARASPDARQVAHWALFTGDNQGRSVVIVDKKQAHAFVFDPEGRLLGDAPVLLGSAVGDHTVPGVGDKPIAQVLPGERTTPAGRFIAEVGMSTTGEDVVWVDFDAAVSMHRVRPWVKSERRLERLASPSPTDNRISYGCINLPRQFYEDVLSPAVRAMGAVVYVLPEASTPRQVFGAYDIPHVDVLALFRK